MSSLAGVLTVQEVARLWGKTRGAVRYHVDRGNFRWRYTAAGRILIERDSVIALWGPPQSDLDEEDIYGGTAQTG